MGVEFMENVTGENGRELELELGFRDRFEFRGYTELVVGEDDCGWCCDEGFIYRF